MSDDVYIFEVSEKSFGQSVLLNSHKIPVMVQFMGVWSEPCVLMADLFSGLAREFAGQFIFAKVDIDEQPEFARQYGIENVPTMKVFKDGEVVRSEVGQLQEVAARRLLKDFGIYRESDLLREQARDKHLASDTNGAILLLTEAIQKDPGNTRVAMDMVQIFLDLGELQQAKSLYERLPEKDKQTEMGKSLNGQLVFAELAAATDGIEALSTRLQTNENDLDARFDLAVCLVAKFQIEDTMQHLFHIMQTDADYRDGAAREMIVTIINMIAPVNNDMAQQFRRQLANIMSA